MKLPIPQYTFLLITLLVVSCQDKQEEEVISSANELLTAYYKTVGGYDDIKAIETKIIDGHYIEPGYNLLLKAHQEYKRPYYRIVGDTAQGFAEGFDGESWEYNKKKGYYRSKGEAEKATFRGAEFDEFLSTIKKKDMMWNSRE